MSETIKCFYDSRYDCSRWATSEGWKECELCTIRMMLIEKAPITVGNERGAEK